MRPRILFSGRKLIQGSFRANELSARKLEGGLVKWKQRNKYDILCLCFCVQLAAQLCADE